MLMIYKLNLDNFSPDQKIAVYTVLPPNRIGVQHIEFKRNCKIKDLTQEEIQTCAYYFRDNKSGFLISDKTAIKDNIDYAKSRNS